MAYREHTQRVGRAHLLLHVVQGIRRVDSKADQDNVGVGVRQRSETIVILLTSSIP